MCSRLDDGCDPSVNGIPKRMVIDEVQNAHGKQFIDFLKAAGLCMHSQWKGTGQLYNEWKLSC